MAHVCTDYELAQRIVHSTKMSDIQKWAICCESTSQIAVAATLHRAIPHHDAFADFGKQRRASEWRRARRRETPAREPAESCEPSRNSKASQPNPANESAGTLARPVG